uniref:Uncharacterized protein n=1 Tax=Clytia hemisphaerica TaxID=252671 RepID=A0A7M5X3V5_9CNID|eukprot:TCONS_00003131-protein
MDKITKIFADVFNEQTWHKVKDNTLAFSGLIFGVLVVFVLIAIGWFVVWKMFLVRFPLIRELVYGSSAESEHKLKSKRTSSASSQNGLQPRRSARLRQKQASVDTVDE